MNEVRVFARGIPKPQPRPRAFARKTKDGGAVARMYDAGTAESWKADVIAALAEHRPESPIVGPVIVSTTFYMPRPQRLMRRKDPEGPVPHAIAADRDNLDKAVLDAMKTDGWFRDDGQVYDGRVAKFYHAKGGVPGAEIWIQWETAQ